MDGCRRINLPDTGHVSASNHTHCISCISLSSRSPTPTHALSDGKEVAEERAQGVRAKDREVVAAKVAC